MRSHLISNYGFIINEYFRIIKLRRIAMVVHRTTSLLFVTKLLSILASNNHDNVIL